MTSGFPSQWASYAEIVSIIFPQNGNQEISSATWGYACICLAWLSHRGLAAHSVSEMSHRRFRYWRVNCSVASPQWNKSGLCNLNPRHIFQRNFNRNLNISIQENAFDIAVCISMTECVVYANVLGQFRPILYQWAPILFEKPAYHSFQMHYSGFIMSATASQITGVSIVCSTVCSGADQTKHQSSVLPALAKRTHRWTVDSPHKGPVTRKMFPFDDVIMVPCLQEAQKRFLWNSDIMSNYQPAHSVPKPHLLWGYGMEHPFSSWPILLNASQPMGAGDNPAGPPIPTTTCPSWHRYDQIGVRGQDGFICCHLIFPMHASGGPNIHHLTRRPSAVNTILHLHCILSVDTSLP